MKILYRVLIITLIIFIVSCGKKSVLERYRESDFPRNYPIHDEK